ncbi:MAG: thiolase family protein [Deltaproteobacteria bacterium]|nr:thiolase family protein [Deltaproteobacteria bacterium]
MEDVVIIGGLRTPVGRLLGKLSRLSAPRLGSIVIKELIGRYRLESLIDEVIMGNAVSAGVGQNPARQAALMAGLPDTINAFTVNKVCASGLKAVALGAEAIMLGEADAVIAGGMESMSNAPFLLRDMRRGRKYGEAKIEDSMINDGLLDCYYGEHMGELCEHTVARYNISREDQDSFALQSHKKAMKATDEGIFRDEIAPVEIDGEIIDIDETIRRDTTLKKLSGLDPVFKKGGTITAGNSPGLNDGAAALVLMSRTKADRLKIKPVAEIIGFASSHTDPKWFTIAPVSSVNALLKKTGMKVNDFDLIEENEAFAAQTLAVIKELSIDPLKLNVHGGAIALGHPIGASGARILVTLINALQQRGGGKGLATICLGGGGAMSMAVRTI